MKILLLGEYSRLHNSLKEGLNVLGHEVTIVGTGDNFKKYQVDYSIYPSFFLDYWMNRKFKNLIFRLTKIDLAQLERGLRFYLLLPKLKDFDHVQLINSNAIETSPVLNRFLYKKVFQNIKSRSLLICGEETPIIDFLLKNELPYSILTPYLKGGFSKKEFRYSLKYTQNNYRKTFNWLQENCQNLIVSDLDYKIPMDKMNFKTHFIPNPINIDQIKWKELKISDKIIIFLGINRLSEIKKGTVYFEKALEIIKEKYLNKVEIIITENIPYKEYINLYNKTHILLDQVYGFDQGYNALEAMAKGKVVFTGAEKDFEKQYNLTEKVAINALPDVDYLVNELSFLIENPSEIIAIGKRAGAFIEKEHHYISIAKKYLSVWETNSSF